MKLITIYFTLFIAIVQVHSETEEIEKINSQSHLINEKVQNISSLLIKELESYSDKLISALKNISIFADYASVLFGVVNRYKSLDFQYLDDLKSCHDLMLRRNSFYIGNNKFKVAAFDELMAWQSFRQLHQSIELNYNENKAEIDENVKNFSDVLAFDKITLMRNELDSLLQKLPRHQKLEIENLTKSCDCPASNISSVDFSANNDEYQKVINILRILEQAKMKAFEIMINVA